MRKTKRSIEYVLPSLDDPHIPISFQSDRRLWARVKKSINVYGKTLQSMGGWKDLATMKNICVHTQDEDLEIARRILTFSNA